MPILSSRRRKIMEYLLSKLVNEDFTHDIPIFNHSVHKASCNMSLCISNGLFYTCFFFFNH
uniref:Uncharacterized protein n=1 Tax=Medicago truncatula TaxID=3880 RepID=A2Q4S3_MEDTR|nr:hypothetical protein MtrDRAFT_AC157777g39v2 [Medicago truncatula]